MDKPALDTSPMWGLRVGREDTQGPQSDMLRSELYGTVLPID